jgi:hypothetical protein
MRSSTRTAAIGVAVLATLCGKAALAQDAEQDWSFELTPYLFAANMDGTAGMRGLKAKVDLDIDTILDHLDHAFMGQFEMRRGPWGFGFEGIYFKLKHRHAR